MTNRPLDSAFIFANWILLIAGTLSFFAFIYGRSVVDEPQSMAARTDEGSLSSAKDDFDSISDRLIVESIVAIVQNYYVDENRISGEQLIQGALNQLMQKFPELEISHNNTDVVVSQRGREITSFSANPLAYDQLLDSLIAISRYVHKAHFSDDISDNQLEVRLSRGYLEVLDSLLRGLDAHSMFLDAEEYGDLRQGTEGQFGGLGIIVGIRDNLLTVIKPLPNSPALAAGLRPMDKIIRINGVETFGFTLDQLVEHMRGDPGSKVSLSILRPGMVAPVSFELERQRINVDSVSYEIMENNKNLTGYLAIESFASRTSEEVRHALDTMRQEAGNKFNGLIMDLRSNPGGLLDQAVQVADIFLQDGVIVSTKGRREEVEYARDSSGDIDFPVIILINGDTASASEIVSGALQDHHKALVVGQPTFGKGTVQTIFELPGGQALKLTVARYYTPSFRSIQTVGIVPDIWVQPIFKEENNADLMGGYHYRSEKFLSNHIALQAGYEDVANVVSYPYLLKGYYLQGARGVAGPGKLKDPSDYELQLAKSILDDVSHIHGNRLEPEIRRSQQWLAAASGSTLKSLKSMQRYTDNWLIKQFNVEWIDGERDEANQLEFNADFNDLDTVIGGETYSIPFVLKNISEQDVERVSVFLWTHSGHIYNEKLVGVVRKATSTRGSIDFRVPFGIDTETLNLNIALSFDAVPQYESNRQKLLRVKGAQTPTFKIVANYVDSSTDGKIDPGENGELRVVVENLDRRDYENLSVKIVTLSGGQIEMQNKRLQHIDVLTHREQKATTFTLTAPEKISANRLYFGCEIYAGDKNLIYTKGFSLEANANIKVPRSALLIGH